MATKKKLLQAAAGNAGGDALNVENVFSTYLYDGNSTTRSIVNGIDLSGEGGLVWTKLRGPNNSTRHVWIDTVRGVQKYLESNTSDAEETRSNSLTAFNSNGYSVENWGSMNASGQTYASWTFRKAPKFFDVVTYTGDGVAGREIAHNLGTDVGVIFIKRTNSSSGWRVFHRSEGGTKYAMLQATNAFASASTVWNNTNPTSTVFTVGTDTDTNGNGGTFVAYIFAHNDGDGGFGPDADADAIKCGSYTGNGSTTGPVVDLGFEPQWVMIKRTDTGGAGYNWFIFDAMRGMPVGGADQYLSANLADAEAGSSERFKITPTGFQLASTSGSFNSNGGTYIYMAIRRGTAVPTSATDVFGIDNNTGQTGMTTGVVTDFGFAGQRSGTDKYYVGTRLLQGSYLNFNSTASESSSASFSFDQMDGFFSAAGSWNGYIGYGWKRAPNYMDVVAYTGNGTPNNHAPTLTHNLGAVPEMLWVKKRSGTSNWAVVVKSGTGGVQAYLDSNNGNVGTLATTGPSNTWSDYFTSTQVIGDGGSGSAFYSPFPVTNLNVSGSTYIMYLFATLAGISKVGSVTHSGTTNVDCGFSSGARFVLLKRTDASGDWYVWDSERGIVSGNDPYLLLNTTGAEVTNTDYIDPLSSGFTITSSFTAGDYIFYAVS